MTTTENVTPQTKETLFEIGETFHALESLIIEADGEITEEVDTWLHEYESRESDKVDAYVFLVRKYEEIASEAQRLAKRATVYKNKADNLKPRLKQYMELRGKQKIETGRFSVSVTRNGGKLPVELNEGILPEDLPEQFQKLTVEADLDRLREALLAEQSELNRFARIGERGSHLRIK